MKVYDHSLEGIVIKYTLATVFVGVTLIFVGKVGALLITVAGAKLVAFKTWLLSGAFLGDLANALKDAIFGGGK